MTRNVSLILLAITAALGFSSCAETPEPNRGPVSESTSMPWNTPIAGQGGGQLGAMPQNQYRR